MWNMFYMIMKFGFQEDGADWGCLRIGAEENIFEPKRGEVMGVWRNLNNEEHHDLYISADIIRVIKSKWMSVKGM